MMRQNTIKSEVISPGREYPIRFNSYPVDLSLFLDTFWTHLALEDYCFAQLQKNNNPLIMAQCALVCWNSYTVSGEVSAREVFLKCALWLVEHAQAIGDDVIGWSLSDAHSDYVTRGCWLSSVAQGCGLSVLARAYQLTSDIRFLDTAHAVAHAFGCDILDGGVCAPIGTDGVFFEEVAVYPAAHTLQGCVFALLGLSDYVAITGNTAMQQYLEQGEATLHSVFDEFDAGFWTRADLLTGRLATPRQLTRQIALLAALATCRKCSHCLERTVRWRRYQEGAYSRFRYMFARRRVLLQQAMLRRLRAIIIPEAPMTDTQWATPLRVCVVMPNHASPGGIGHFGSHGSGDGG